MRKDCALQHHPYRCPCLHSCCRLCSAGASRSRRIAAVGARLGGVARRWAGRVAQEAVSRRNVVLTSALASRVLVWVAGSAGVRMERERRQGGCAVRRRVFVKLSLRRVGTYLLGSNASDDIPCIERSSGRLSRNLLRVRLPQSLLFTRLALAKSQPLCREHASTSICIESWGNGMGD